jgi:hypothetical protein
MMFTAAQPPDGAVTAPALGATNTVRTRQDAAVSPTMATRRRSWGTSNPVTNDMCGSFRGAMAAAITY